MRFNVLVIRQKSACGHRPSAARKGFNCGLWMQIGFSSRIAYGMIDSNHAFNSAEEGSDPDLYLVGPEKDSTCSHFGGGEP